MSTSRRRNKWTYGVFGPVRLLALVPFIVGIAADDIRWTVFGIGWWLACLACEVVYHCGGAAR